MVKGKKLPHAFKDKYSGTLLDFQLECLRTVGKKAQELFGFLCFPYLTVTTMIEV